MSTRSNIARVDPETGAVQSIYCHYDGYLDGVGATLRTFYTTDDAVDELLALGNLSTLGMRPAPFVGEPHSFDTPAPDVTVAYARDRGEDWDGNKPLQHWSIGQWLANCLDNPGYEYLYLFRDERWERVDAIALRARLVTFLEPLCADA